MADSKGYQEQLQMIREGIEFAVADPTQGPLVVAALIEAIVDSPRLRQLTAAIWHDLASAGSAVADPLSNPVPYLIVTPEATESIPYPVGVAWDPSEGPFATVEEGRAGVPNQIILSDIGELMQTPVADTWNGAVDVDLSLGQVLDVALEGNSTASLFNNPRSGVGFMFRVTNGGAFTLSFASLTGVALEAMNDLTVESGDGAVTSYAGMILSGGVIQISKVGSIEA